MAPYHLISTCFLSKIEEGVVHNELKNKIAALCSCLCQFALIYESITHLNEADACNTYAFDRCRHDKEHQR